MRYIISKVKTYTRFIFKQITIIPRSGSFTNEMVYRQKDIVDIYTQKNELFISEKRVMNILKHVLPDMRMLDIGVGGGRTTQYFGQLAKEYVGIDYSPEMIKKCQERFPEGIANITFKLCDARSMKVFDDSTFDFILFSLNGIDMVSHEDRLKILKEVQRVGKTGAYFCFSSHNLQFKRNNEVFNFHFKYIIYPLKLIRWVLYSLVYNNLRTGKKIKQSQYAIFNDGVHDFRLKTYYINPLAQIEQLRPYFKDIQVFSSVTGNEIKEDINAASVEDEWLCYFCRINK